METKVDPNPSVDEVERWYTYDGSLPVRIRVQSYGYDAELTQAGVFTVLTKCLFETEKLAIDAARKHALKAEDRWRETVNQLDARYDTLEEAEMEQGQ